MNKLISVLNTKALLGEGPCWDDKKSLLYWVDIPNGYVLIYNPVNETEKVIKTGQYVSTVVPRKAGGLLLAMHHGFYTLDMETEKIAAVVDPESDQPANRFNDGKCDAFGRLWAGTMAIDESLNKGSLYCLETDFSVRRMLEDISISNGIAWTEDNKTMYFIDTPTQQVAAFDFNINSAALSNKRVVIDFPDGEGFPDGMCIDSEGMLWIAHWGGAQVSRWNPDKGEKIDSIPVPAPFVTSCAFGGEDLTDLYITTARKGMTDEELLKYPEAGSLFKVQPGVKGVTTYHFAD